MQFTRFAVMAGGLALLGSQAWASVPTLIAMDEPGTTLVSPPLATPVIPAFQYTFGSDPVATTVTANPLLCANTAAPSGTSPTGINAVYYSANGRIGTSPQPFVFGASIGSPATSEVAYGATNLIYNGSQVQFGGDPLDALVCYGLDANGVRRVTRDLFADGFEVPGTDGLLGNSTVTLSVFHLPSGPSDYYGYTIDVTIPPLPNNIDCNMLDCNFALVEGYDTSVFRTNAGGWCLASNPTDTSCDAYGGYTNGDINYSYDHDSATNNSLVAPISPSPAAQYHFVLHRYYKTGVIALPAAPVAVAALFSPLDLEENKLDDNVATGNNTL